MTESNDELYDPISHSERMVELYINNTEARARSASNEDTFDITVIDRYLSGESTVDETASIEQMMISDATYRSIVERLRTIPYASTDDAVAIDVDAQWQRVAGSTHPRDGISNELISNTANDSPKFDVDVRYTEQPATRTIHVALPWVAFTAAIMAVGVILGVVTTNLARHSTSGALMTYSTAASQRSSIQLADGTGVILNVGSQIRIPENFSSGNRTVYLDGEAYFDVTHATGAPFTVETHGASTKVLGTKFGVRAYAGTPISVAVQSGRVSVNRVTLNANDIASVQDGNVRVMHNQAVDAMLGFVTGHLILRDIPLRDAILDLNRWYDADIRLANEDIGSFPIRATLRGESIAELMTVLQLTFGVNVVRDGRVLTLYRAY